MQQSTNRAVNVNVLFNRPTIQGWELRQGIDQFAHHTCMALGLDDISVTWDDSVSTACINMHGNIIVRGVRDDATITNTTLVRYAGFIVHELLHRHYTSFRVEPKWDQENRKYVMHLLNAIEDAWIERTAIKSGLLGNIKGLLTGLINGMVREAQSGVQDWADPAQYPFSLAIYAREFCSRVPVPAELVPVFEQATRRIDSSRGTADNLDIALWVYEQLKLAGQNPEPRDNPDQGRPCDNPSNPSDDDGDNGNESGSESGEGSESDQSGDDTGSESGKGNGSGDNTESESGEGSGDDTGSEGSEGAQDGAQDAPEGPTGGEKGEGEGKGAPGEKKAPKPKDAGPVRSPSDDQNSRDVEPSARPESGNESARGGSYSEQSNIIDPDCHRGGQTYSTRINVPAKLRYEIRRLFDDSSSTLFNPNRKSGSLNPRALHKFGQSDRLFQQRKDIEGIDSAVVVIIDASGSMQGSRMKNAVETAVALIDSLHSANVATAVLTFGCNVSVQIPFGGRTQQNAKCLGRIKDCGGTNDFAAIRYAHDLLRVRRETRKVCFVLTDGFGAVAAAKQQITAGEKSGITTIGIGIGGDVSSVYGKSVTVYDSSKLAEVSFSQIKTVI